MKREITFVVDEATFVGLVRRAGWDNVSEFVENLVRERVLRPYTEAELETGYREMAADEEAEREAFEVGRSTHR